MVGDTASAPVSTSAEVPRAVKVIVIGGLLAGTLDIAQALFLFGRNVPLSIAGGVLGRAARHGGTGTYLLGLALHYFIATSWTAVYYAASRRLSFMLDHPVVCGLLYGMVVELFMRLVVLPLSALHAAGPFTFYDEVLGLLIHMVTIGLPIAFTVRILGRQLTPS